jgi:hypothetical protein
MRGCWALALLAGVRAGDATPGHYTPHHCGYPDPPANPPLSVKTCYELCERNVGDTPCQRRQCKDSCWYGNDFCYNSCVGGCYPWAFNFYDDSYLYCPYKDGSYYVRAIRAF